MSRRSRRRNINALIVATAVAVLLYFLLSFPETVTTPTFSNKLQSDKKIEFYINNTQMTEYDEQGNLDAIIISEYIEQNPKENSIDMTAPKINLYNEGAANWTISSDFGSIHDDGHTINLEQQVKVINNDRSTLLKTPFLIVKPHTKTANTDKPVSLVTNKGVTRATGLKADLDSKKIELLSKVRGQYEPQAVSDYVE